MPPVRLALLIIVLLAALPRWFLLGDAGGIWHPDEFYFVYKPLGFFSGDLNPHLFNYPSLLFYLTAALYGIAFVGQNLFGAGMSLDEWVLYHYFWHPEKLLPIARFLTFFFALGTVYLTGLVAEKLADARTGLIAALLAALSAIHLRQSGLAAVDLPMCFWVLAALYFALCLVEENSLRLYLLAGLCTGLAASSKYPGGLAGMAVFAAHIAAQRDDVFSMRSALKSLVAGRLWLAGLISLLTFVLTSPYVVLDFATFWQYFSRELAHAADGHGADLGSGWWYHIAVTLRYNLGYLGLVGLAVGLLLALKKSTRMTWVLLALFVSLYAAIGSSRTVFVRYALPLCLLEAVFCALVLYHLRRWRWSLLLLPLLLIEPLYASHRLVQIASGQDARLQARRWIEENVPAGATLCNFGGWYGDVPLRTFEHVWWQQWNYENAYSAAGQKNPAQLPGPLREHLDFLEETRPQTPYFSYIIDGGNHPDERGSLRAVGDYDCDCVVLHRHPLSYSTIDSSFYAELQGRGTLLQRFEPVGLAASSPAYDPIDAYYLPIGRFGQLRAPGPQVEIWRVKERTQRTSPSSARELLAQGYAIGSSVRLLQKRPGEAYAMNTRALALDADNVEALLTRALLYREKGDRREALRLLRAAVEREPQHATALYNLAALAAQAGQLDDAANAFARFMALRPDYARAYYELGVVLYRQREYQRALEIAEQGMALMPDDANIHFLLGNAHAALGRRTVARVHYEKMLELDPGHPRASAIRLLLLGFE